MYIFLAEYQDTFMKISILSKDNKTIATRDLEVVNESFVQNLTSELIELSHEQNLYHNDIMGIGVVIDYKLANYDSKENFIRDLEDAFGFKAVVGIDRSIAIGQFL